jgi:hypothetical protein
LQDVALELLQQVQTAMQTDIALEQQQPNPEQQRATMRNDISPEQQLQQERLESRPKLECLPVQQVEKEVLDD